MQRVIVVPAVLAGAALDELKAWLAIGSPREDAMLTALLRAGLELCEAFTGQTPLEAQCEELVPACGGWQRLQTRPIQAIEAVEGIPAEGPRIPLAPADYMIELDADGGARVRVLRQGAAGRLAVRFTAGIATSWELLPDTGPRVLDPAVLGPSGTVTVAAIGLADNEPVLAPLLNPGLTLRPLTPVHPHLEQGEDGSRLLRWTRRARGAWSWVDGVDAPVGEDSERYLVGIGDPDLPNELWETAEPRLIVAAATWATLVAAYPGQVLWVRQVGRHAASPPLHLVSLT